MLLFKSLINQLKSSKLLLYFNLKPLLDFIVDTAIKHNRKFSPIRFPVAYRIKSIGQMGNYMKTKSYSVMQENGETIDMSGDDIFKLPDGRLTTMYHYLKGMKTNDSDKQIEKESILTEEVKA